MLRLHLNSDSSFAWNPSVCFFIIFVHLTKFIGIVQKQYYNKAGNTTQMFHNWIKKHCISICLMIHPGFMVAYEVDSP